MKKEEARLQAEVDELTRQVEQVNTREDKRFDDCRALTIKSLTSGLYTASSQNNIQY